MKKIFVIGHSHLNSLKRAPTADDLFEFHNINDKGMGPLSKINSDDYLSTILLVGGNYHNVFGLLNHPQPFDFYLPEKTDLPINPNARLLPVELVSSVLERDMVSRQYNVMSSLLRFFKNTVYQIESPPPVPSEAHIKKYPGVFRDKINQLGVSPAAFRYKLWRIHSKIVRENCQKLGITFVTVPKESQDSDGFLAEQYWNPDPTHGNQFYGDLVLNQIRAMHNIETKQAAL